MQAELDELIEGLLKEQRKEEVLNALNYLADLDENEMQSLVVKVNEIEETTNH